MYPTIYNALKDLTGIDISFLKIVNSFGFFVALSFVAASYTLTRELRRKENMLLIQKVPVTVRKGFPISIAEIVINGIMGFLFGWKIGGIFLDSNALNDVQDYLFSSQGSFIFGLLLAGGMIYLKYREKEKHKLDKPEVVTEMTPPSKLVGDMTVIAAISGLIGAKFFHQFEYWDDFMKDPIGNILSVSGLTFYGGLICGAGAVIYYAWKKGINLKHLIDSAAPGLILAYGVGRMGCQVAGDGDWGLVNTASKPDWMSFLPDWMWAYKYPHNVNKDGVPIEGCENTFWGDYCYELSETVFPTPFYEILMSLTIFGILWYLRKKINIPGVLFSIYLIFNGLERFTIEPIRDNSRGDFFGIDITQAQLISSSLIILGVAGILYFMNHHKNNPPTFNKAENEVQPQ